jgi:uncharacterized membrane protein
MVTPMTASFTPAIWVHVFAAVAALVLGATIFLARKGTLLHKLSGRVWAGLMLVTAVSTIWIKGNGSYSWIHVLSVATVLILAGVVYAAMNGRIQRHRQGVIGLYAGSLIVAGLFALMPERLLGRMVWGSLGLL